MKRLAHVDWTNMILWGVFLALLAVLMPHTAWLFASFEEGEQIGITAWAAAFAFEAAIAVLVHKLAQHIEHTPKYKSRWKRFSARYLNAFSLGLIMTVGVSALANLAHAVEYGQTLKIFAAWGIQPKVYQVAFGAVLPVVSLLFARVLSNVSESEAEPNAEDERIRQLRRQLREAEKLQNEAEQRAIEAEKMVGEFLPVFSDSKADRIRAAHMIWPDLPGSSIAVIAGSAPSYVSEVLGSLNGNGSPK